jgi:hypothetical protein
MNKENKFKRGEEKLKEKEFLRGLLLVLFFFLGRGGEG